ncbi:hypothetical protein FACS1894163_08180 [Spirochaetia bacterium]|nr:hypothetical protein FACS1894163_08180 [Spirochaetia bacterium]
MNNKKLFRGQGKQYDDCLFVPSALRGYWPSKCLIPNTDCYNEHLNTQKVEKFLKDIDIRIDLTKYKNECSNIPRLSPFQDCDDDIPYIFWLSIVFCEYKFSHMGKNLSFSSTGHPPYFIDMGVDVTGAMKCLNFKIDKSQNIMEYAKRITKYYFKHTPPIINDNFLRIYMEHQHYFEKSIGYNTFQKYYKTSGGDIVDYNNLPDHFTLLLDWTENEDIAKEFAGNDGTIISIDSAKYEALLGNGYKMSYNDPIIEYRLIDTAEPQKSVVTFWPWKFTINQLKDNALGKTLGFESKKIL